MDAVKKKLAVLKKAMTKKIWDGHQKDGRQSQGGSTPQHRMEAKVHKTNGNGRRLESGKKFPAWLKNWSRC